MLQVERLCSFYGRAQILHDVGFAIAPGSVAVLLGRNGAGKSTVLKSLIGLVPPQTGRIRFETADIAGLPPHRIARTGIGYVPEERRIFAELTVAENLETGRRPPRPGLAPWTAARLFALFPALAELRRRPAGRMSGGEQQMLAIARTLMGNPRLVLLDEPGEGLAPLMVRQIEVAVRALREEGVSLLIAEQGPAFARAVADQVLVMEKGAVVWSGTHAALDADAPARRRYLAL